MWALIQDGTVTEITDIDPTGRFHPSLQLESADETVEVGDQFDGESFRKPLVPLGDVATLKRAEIATALADALAAGMAYTMPDGSEDTVQMLAEDRQNLLGLAMEAERLKASGVTDAAQEFRGLSNKRYPMTPDEVIAMTDAALSHYKALLQSSWDRKDAIDAALEAGDREAIEAVAW